MLRKDLQTAWNLLHILSQQPQKTILLQYELETKYGMTISLTYLRKMIIALDHAGLLVATKNKGVAASGKRVIYMRDVMQALSITYGGVTTAHPAGRIEANLINILEESTIVRS